MKSLSHSIQELVLYHYYTSPSFKMFPNSNGSAIALLMANPTIQIKPETTVSKIEFLPRKAIQKRTAEAVEMMTRYDQMRPEFIVTSVYTQRERERMFEVRTDADLSSPRLGAIGPALCQTCNLPGGVCPGHNGIIYLPEQCRFLTPAFKQYLSLVLNSICINCGCLRKNRETLIEEGILRIKNPFERLRRVSDISSGITNCANIHRNCGRAKKCGVLPQFPKLPSKFDASVPGDSKMTVNKVYELLQSVEEDTCHILGFANKEAIQCFTANYVIVTPTIVRPDLILGNTRTAHKLTTLYSGILKVREDFRKKIITPESAPTLMYNAVCALLYGKSSEPLGKQDAIPIAAMLPKKEGEIRKNCTGKRLNETGRDVLQTAELPFGYLYVPRSNFSAIGFEYVILDTPASKQLVQQWAKDNIIMTFRQPRAEAARIQYTKAHINSLVPGMIVERHLLPGDWTIAIRQPTLSIHSCLGFRILPGAENIIQIDRRPITGYNADFDGDEFNIKIVTSAQQIPECKYLMGVSRCQGSAKGNRTVPCCILDSIIGGYLISQSNRYLDDTYIFIAHSRMRKVPKLDAIRRRVEMVGGIWNSSRTLLSMCLPEDFCYEYASVKIVKGVFLSGQLTKEHLKDTPDSIMQYIRLRFGEQIAKYYLNNVCQTLEMWVSERYGLSLGIGDCNLTLKEDTIHITNLYLIARNLYQFYSIQRDDEFLRRLYYYRLTEGARAFTENAEKINTDLIPESNAFRLMSFDAKSKGDKKNIMQILNAVGQQFIFGQLPKRTLTDNSRVCYSSDIYDPNPLTTGLCVNSYITGLTPDELLQAATTGRNGITDTTTKTPQVGKISRRTNNALGAIRSGEMHEIRGNESRIVQFTYNGDGYDGTQSYLKSNKVVPFDIDSLVNELNAEAGWIFDEKAQYVESETNPISISVPDMLPRMTMYEFVKLQTNMIKDIESGKLSLEGYPNDSNVCKIVKKMIARGEANIYFIHRDNQKICVNDMLLPFGVSLAKYQK